MTDQTLRDSQSESPIVFVARNICESPLFQRFIYAVILINSVVLASLTSDSIVENYGTFLNIVDDISIAIFVVEIMIRITAWGRGFFKDGWNLFDLTVVIISLLPMLGESLTVLRSLRIIRALRLLSGLPSVRRIVTAVLKAIPGMASSAMVLAGVLFISAVIATNYFKGSHPEWFGTIGESAFTLFQIMTLESWAMGIVRPVMEVYPYSYLFFVPFVVVSSFLVLNLVIGVIVTAMDSAVNDEEMAAGGDPVYRKLVQLEDRLEQQSRLITRLAEALHAEKTVQMAEEMENQRHKWEEKRGVRHRLSNKLGEFFNRRVLMPGAERRRRDTLQSALMAGTALVVTADGEVHEAERKHVERIFKELDLVKFVSPKKALQQFDNFCEELQAGGSRDRLLHFFEPIKKGGLAAEIIYDTCVALSAADGDVDESEEKQLEIIQRELGVSLEVKAEDEVFSTF